jgi:hypothetical protein
MDSILFWNSVALEVHRRDFAFDVDMETGKPQAPQQGGPTRTSRALAIVHLAMYDAWNGARGIANNYLNVRSGQNLLPAAPPPAASADTAAASAAATALKVLFSRQAAYIESKMQEFCASASVAGQSAQQKRDGQDYGRAVAQALLDFRAKDGSDAADDYIAGDAPGQHRPDPYNPVQGYLGSRWGRVTPFCVNSPANGGLATYINPPPSFTSQKYQDDFEEVREFGALERRLRTTTQELTGLYWAYDGAKGLGTPPRLYNQIVQKIAEDQNNTPDQNARLFALINAGMADAGIVAWEAKYVYNFWRPIIGVREDDEGTGPSGLGTGSAADGDPFWRAYGAPASNQPGAINFTPPFPAYPSGHATFGTTVFEIVRRFYPPAIANNLTFEFVSDELNGKTVDVDGSTRTFIKRTYTLDEAIQDNLESRIWLGVHWRFDGEGGQQAGVQVAQQIVASPHLQ